jgi:gluconokinase
MVVLLMGVTGSGKSTVGACLSASTGWTFYDGDDFHSPEAKAKMSSGQPLTDEDRIPWLERQKRITMRASRAERTASWVARR